MEDGAHEDKEQILIRGTGMGGSDGFRACGGIFLTMGSDPVNSREDRRSLRKHITGIIKPMPCLPDSNKGASGKAGEVHSRHWEREIDQMVYDLYSLTEEQIKILEGRI